MTASPRNEEIGELLARIGDLLDVQGAGRYRVAAYRRAAQTAFEETTPMAERLAETGTAGLEKLEGIGKGIASLIAEFVHTGRAPLLERLEGESSPEELFMTVPGIGPELAERLHRELNVETLEELEIASHDGRLRSLRGFGERRVRGMQETLAGLLSHSTRRRARRGQYVHGTHEPEELPSVASILAVDEDYRRRADARQLRKIAPRRFNPTGKAWLPILHVDREDWFFTALYSNTARAHELGKTRDWVVIHFEGGAVEGQCTVVTEHRGRLAGRRTIRGRESECVAYYAKNTEFCAQEGGPVD